MSLKDQMTAKLGPAALKRPATLGEVYDLIDIMATTLAKQSERLAALEAGGIKYMGVWQAANAYGKGSLVTHKGSMWHANADTAREPGDGKEWTLAVKAGKDAR